MKRKAVGFYWTLPVPWAGFTDLGKTIDEAATRSRTIRFQRELIRRYAASQGFDLIHEEAFLEIAPDRGSEMIGDALGQAACICRQHGASLLHVDFSGVQGWRSHKSMREWLAEADLPDDHVIDAASIEIDGKTFDPHAHFSAWRERQWSWAAGKEERVDKAVARATQLQSGGLKNAAIARLLNQEGIRSVTGRLWTEDSLRKFLKSNIKIDVE